MSAPTVDPPRMYTAEQVSELTQKAVAASWLEKQAAADAIPARKVGRSWRWTVEDINKLYDTFLRIPRQRSQR